MLHKLLAYNHDVTGAGYTYVQYSDPINSPKYLITSGSSTTVSEANSTDNTFAGFGVGDIIEVTVDGATTVRVVTAVGSIPDSVTVNSAVNWQNGTTGRAFSFRRKSSGTGANDGWFRITETGGDRTITVNIATFNVATSIDLIVEGRITVGATLTSATIYTKSYTAVTAAGDSHAPIVIPENVDEIRVGWKLTGADTGANEVYAFFRGTDRRVSS